MAYFNLSQSPGSDALAGEGTEQPDTEQYSGRLSDVAYARIAGSIASGSYPVGSKLPTEHDLAERLSMSRPVVREALARLKDSGMVVSRRGSGTYVRRAPQPVEAGQAPLSSIIDMKRCLEFRIGVESDAAYHAAADRTPADLDRLAVSLDALAASVRVGEINVDQDYRFHLDVAAASGNRFYVATLSTAGSAIKNCMSITRNFALLHTQARLLQLHAEHAAVFEAIEARQPDAARAAMRHHLQSAMERAFNGTF